MTSLPYCIMRSALASRAVAVPKIYAGSVKESAARSVLTIAAVGKTRSFRGRWMTTPIYDEHVPFAGS
jgi:hypothetical protein